MGGLMTTPPPCDEETPPGVRPATGAPAPPAAPVRESLRRLSHDMNGATAVLNLECFLLDQVAGQLEAGAAEARGEVDFLRWAGDEVRRASAGLKAAGQRFRAAAAELSAVAEGVDPPRETGR